MKNMQWVRRFDLFRKAALEDVRRTRSGAIVTILVLSFAFLIFCIESLRLFTTYQSTSIILDPYSDSNLYIQLITKIFHAPCDILSIEILDQFGRETINAESPQIWKTITINGYPSGLYQGGAPDGDALENPLSKFLLKSNQQLIPPVLQESTALIESNFEQILSQFSYSLVDFYSSRCIWCRKVSNTYELLALYISERPSLKDRIGIHKVNCDISRELCLSQHIKGVPTLRLFKRNPNGINQGIVDYSGKRTVQDMMEFLMRSTTELDGILIKNGSASDSNVGINAYRKLKDNEGCIVSGTFEVKRIPGSIRIFANTSKTDFDMSELNLSHSLSRIQFTNSRESISFTRNDIQYQIDQESVTKHVFISHEHFFRLVSVVTRSWNWIFGYVESESFEYSKTSMQVSSEPALPEIRISFDVIPNAVLREQYSSRKWYDYITNLLALIGGLIAIGRVFDASALTITEKFINKRKSRSKVIDK